jgi:hypothetical protein
MSCAPAHHAGVASRIHQPVCRAGFAIKLPRTLPHACDETSFQGLRRFAPLACDARCAAASFRTPCDRPEAPVAIPGPAAAPRSAAGTLGRTKFGPRSMMKVRRRLLRTADRCETLAHDVGAGRPRNLCLLR